MHRALLCLNRFDFECFLQLRALAQPAPSVVALHVSPDRELVALTLAGDMLPAPDSRGNLPLLRISQETLQEDGVLYYHNAIQAAGDTEHAQTYAWEPNALQAEAALVLFNAPAPPAETNSMHAWINWMAAYRLWYYGMRQSTLQAVTDFSQTS